LLGHIMMVFPTGRLWQFLKVLTVSLIAKLSRPAYTLPCPMGGGSYDAVDTILPLKIVVFIQQLEACFNFTARPPLRLQ
jgi:hypothetical protein